MPRIFERSVTLPVSAETAFAWHARPGAFERLTPPWQTIEVERQDGGIEDGARVDFRVGRRPLRIRWRARHEGYRPGRAFVDVQDGGPFAFWRHTHRFEAVNDHACVLTDHVEYRLPLERIGGGLADPLIRSMLQTMFMQRHHVTAGDLMMLDRHAHRPRLTVAISGATGFVGSTLSAMLTTAGHRVRRITRPSSGKGSGEGIGSDSTPAPVLWDPHRGVQNPESLRDVDAIVHLAGEPLFSIGWSRDKMNRIRDSRVEGTRVLCESLARMPEGERPSVLVCASAIGYYGNRGDEVLTESSEVGQGFLAEVCRDWEQATAPAEEAGMRVARARLGVVLDPRGGAMDLMLPIFRLGGGGVLGPGRQWMSWITRDDAASAFLELVMNPDARGPYNLTAPEPVTNRTFTKTLGGVLHRPTVVPVPATAVRLALGEMADEALLASVRAEPAALAGLGFPFRDPELEPALRRLLGKAG